MTDESESRKQTKQAVHDYAFRTKLNPAKQVEYDFAGYSGP